MSSGLVAILDFLPGKRVFQVIKQDTNPGWEKNTSMARKSKSIHDQLAFLDDIIEQFLLKFLLSIGMVTRDNLLHTPSSFDLIFGIPSIKSQIVKYGTHSIEKVSLNKRLGHFPVKTALNIW